MARSRFVEDFQNESNVDDLDPEHGDGADDNGAGILRSPMTFYKNGTRSAPFGSVLSLNLASKLHFQFLPLPAVHITLMQILITKRFLLMC